MENVETSAKNGPQHNNLDNIYVDLNNLELLPTIRDLKDDLQTVKQNNQRILELTKYLMDIMNMVGKR